MARPKKNASRANKEFDLFKIFLDQASSPSEPSENCYLPSFPKDPHLLQQIIYALLLRIKNKKGPKEEAATLFRKIKFIHTLELSLSKVQLTQPTSLSDFNEISEAAGLIDDYLYDLARGFTGQAHFPLVVKIQSLWLDTFLGGYYSQKSRKRLEKSNPKKIEENEFPTNANNRITQINWLKARAGYLCKTLTAMPCFCNYNTDIASSLSLGKEPKRLTMAGARNLFLAELHNTTPGEIIKFNKSPEGHLKHLREPGEPHPWELLLLKPI